MAQRLSIFVWVLALALLVSLAPSAARAQNQGVTGYGFKIYRVDSSLYPFTQVYFRTFDQNMDPLINLTELNFGLMVAGRSYDPLKLQYTIQTLQNRQEAFRSVLVIDCSKTMEGEPFGYALRAAARYVDSKRPQDEVAILAIKDTATGWEVVSEFEKDGGALARRIADMRPDGLSTRLYDSVAAAIAMCGTSSQGGATSLHANLIVSNSIVVISDGFDEGSALSREELNNRITNLAIPIPIYSFGYTQINPSHLVNLESLSKNSLGRYYDVRTDGTALQRKVEDIQRNILQGDYVITFRAYIPVDGAKHDFMVGVEYPRGSGKITYQSAQFSAIQPPPLPPIRDAMVKLNGKLKPIPDGNPYLDSGDLEQFMPKAGGGKASSSSTDEFMPKAPAPAAPQ